MKILVLNCGSTSIKFRLFDRKKLTLLCKGIVDHPNQGEPSIIKYNTQTNNQTTIFEVMCCKSAINCILELLLQDSSSELVSLGQIAAVGHRIAAGGVQFKESMVITPEVIEGIREATVLAPLHNPANIEGILAIQSILGDVKQVAVFDTAFHQTIPEHAYVYGLPYEMYKEQGIRKFGFHGTSHKYASQRACEFLNVPYKSQRIVVAHLGGGSSVCAINKGKSVDVSLGMTSLGGVMMGTRCGDIDPGLIPLIMKEHNLTIDEITQTMYQKSGLLGISGVSEDMREIEEAANAGSARAKLAMDVFAYQIKKQIGSFAAVLGGIDILVFTGGIGENHTYTRKQVCKGLDYLGLDLDMEKSRIARGQEMEINQRGSKSKILIIPTNEELMIARDTIALIAK